MRALVIVLLLVTPTATLVVSCHLSAQTVANLPAKPCSAASPDQRYAVLCRESNKEYVYELLIRELQTGSETFLERFMRGVSVVWAPDSRHVAITYWPVSTDAITVVYSPQGKAILDSLKTINRAFGHLPELTKNDHIYYEALSWRGPEILRIKVWGHGEYNRNGFAPML